ncbi:hypothetical protein BH10PSE12_BH10PSE12_15010 [soil metagenome]
MAGTAQYDYVKYERAAAAFARFCCRNATATPASLIGKKASEAWLAAGSATVRGKRKRIGIYVFGAVLAVIAVAMSIQPFPLNLGLLIALPASWLLGTTMRNSYKSDEPSLEFLIEAATPDERNGIINLDEFCRRAASGRFKVIERHPDGSVRELNADWLKCFAADGGKLLILSSDPADWLRIRRRPVPRGEILIDICSSVASSQLSSRALIYDEDPERFEARIQWLRDRAGGPKGDGFQNVLGIIIAFRRPDLAGKTFNAQKAAIAKDGYGRSMIEKVHAGIYEPFQRFLQTLPLNEFP